MAVKCGWTFSTPAILWRAIAGVLVLYRRGKRVRRGGTVRQRGKSDKGSSRWWEPPDLSSDPSSCGDAPVRNWQPGGAISRVLRGGNEGGGHGVFIGANSGANRNKIGPKHADQIGFGQQKACRCRPPGEDALTGGPRRSEKKEKRKRREAGTTGPAGLLPAGRRRLVLSARCARGAAGRLGRTGLVRSSGLILFFSKNCFLFPVLVLGLQNS
jgi:hypothetical protein